MGGLLEEWDLVWILEKYPGIWTCFPGQPYGDLFAVRPLTVVPCAIAFCLSGNSFFGYHVLLLLACAMKVLAGVAIGRFLFRDTAFALCFGLLFLVYPADTQQIALRNMHINLACGLALVGASLFPKGLLAQKAASRNLALAASALLLVLATWIYEFSLVFYAIPIALIVMRSGFLRTWRIFRKRRKIFAAWLIAPVFSTAYIWLAMKLVSGSYQAGLAPNGVLNAILENWQYLVNAGVFRTFYEGWADSFALFFTELRDPTIVLAFLIVLVCAVFFLSQERTVRSSNTFPLVRYLACGLGLFFVGYVLNMVASSHAVITQRTFLFVVPGAVIVLTSLLFRFFPLAKPVVLTVMIGLVLSGLVSQNYQHFRYAEFYTQAIGPYLNYIASVAAPDKKTHVVIDQSGNSSFLNGLYYAKVVYAPAAILHKPDDCFFLCKNNNSTFLNLASFFRYSIRNGKVTISQFGVGDLVFDEKDVDFITIPRTPLPEASSQPLWNDLNTYNRRWAPFHDPHLVDGVYAFIADSMWGYSDFPRGDGWSDGTERVPPHQAESCVFAIANSATLLVDLGEPQDTEYLFRLHSPEPIPGRIRQELTACLNGEPLSLDYLGRQCSIIQSMIPSGKLKRGLNELSLTGVLPAKDCHLRLQKFLLGPKEKVLQKDGIASVELLELGAWHSSEARTIWPYLYSGFSGNEPNGTWTDRTTAIIRFAVDPAKKVKKIHLGGMAFLNPAHQRFEMIVSLNGHRLGRVLAEEKDMKRLDLSYDVPLTLTKSIQGDWQVALSIPNPATPHEVGARGRFLGFFVDRFMVEGDTEP